ncbi:ABC-type amino acid transport system, permease component [Treponema primitia ZAS-2]|uniref:ABC-type amino acid transport system, permease component n=1 Tax=Treponema primitia (strain ATCC BAA-887 / DSM 12427 / ZAS-2) TaxID=545694 RepID=F5YK73_TREPZ|nr:ABC transporter permease subunit [Treponema primitia]AEF85873.1 ABC-type amino acid transport system, permease component [Treponema primitia ZAS-2]
MSFDFKFMLVALAAGVSRVPTSLYIGLIPVLIGIVLGLPIALVRFYEIKVLSPLFNWIVTIVRGIPIVMLLLVFYIVATRLYTGASSYKINTSLVAISALTLPAVVGISEIFRGCLGSVGREQFDAAYASGYTTIQLLFKVVLPQIIPVSIPMMGNTVIGMIKAAVLASMISVIDILDGALRTAENNFRYLEAYIAAALIYWALAFILTRIFSFIEGYTKSKISRVAEPVTFLIFPEIRRKGKKA